MLYSFQKFEEIVVKRQVLRDLSKEVPGFLKLSVPDLIPADRVFKIQNGRHNTGRVNILSMKVSSSLIHFPNGCEGFPWIGFNE